MARIVTSLKYASFVYDFAVDGGSVGNKAMGRFLPPNCTVWFGYANVLTTLTSGGAALISVGFLNGATNLLINQSAYTNFTANAIVPGVDLPAAPKDVTSESQLCLTISGAALLTGKLIYFCVYTEGSYAFPIPSGIGAMIIGSTFIVG